MRDTRQAKIDSSKIEAKHVNKIANAFDSIAGSFDWTHVNTSMLI